MTASAVKVRTDDGCDLHVEQDGEGQPLLLISGLGGKADFWGAVRTELRHHFRLMMFDHRGTGHSDRPTDGYSIARLAADALAVLDALDIPRASVVGHSTGGAIAQTLALDASPRVDRLVISGSWARADYRFRLLFKTRLAVIQQAGPAAYAALGQILSFPPDWISAHEEAIERVIVQAAGEHASQAPVEARLRMLFDHDRLDELHRITSPTLVLGAADDMIVPFYHSRLIAERVGQAKLVEISGGHFFPQTAPLRFAEAVIAFVQHADAI